MKLHGFVGQSYVARNPQFDCSRCVNLYPSVNEQQSGANQQVAQLLSTPGLTNALTTTPTGQGVRGGYTSTQNQSFFVVDATVYYCNGPQRPYVPVPIGTLLTNRGRVRFADNGSQMVIVDGPYGYVVDLTLKTVVQITDPAFYGSDFVEFYDGYFIFAKPGTTLFYWSDPNAVTFDALNFASKSGNADPISGFVVYLRQLWLIGTQTTEIWYDVGGDVTFQRLAGPYIEQGCAAPDTIAKSEGGIFWLAQSLRGGISAVMTVGTTVQKVSTLAVDYQIGLYEMASMRATGFCYEQDGDSFYVVNPCPTASSTWVYDATVSALLGVPTWHERTYMVSPAHATISVPNGTEIRALPDNSWSYNGDNLCGSYRDGHVYFYDNLNYTDNGAYVQRTRQAPHVAADGNRIFYGMFRLLAQVGVGGAQVVTTVTAAANVNTTITLNASTIGGACNYTAYNNSQFGIYGSVSPGVVGPGENILFLGEGTTAFGSGPGTISLLIAGVEPQSYITQVQYTDRLGNVQTFAGNTATYAANSGNFSFNSSFNTLGWANSASWTWNNPKAYTSFGNSNGTVYGPFAVVVTYATPVSVSKVSSVSDPQVRLSWSDDGGNLWSDEIAMSMGQVGRYNQQVEWWRLGYGRNRVFRIRCAEPAAFNIYDAVIEAQATQA